MTTSGLTTYNINTHLQYYILYLPHQKSKTKNRDLFSTVPVIKKKSEIEATVSVWAIKLHPSHIILFEGWSSMRVEHKK